MSRAQSCVSIAAHIPTRPLGFAHAPWMQAYAPIQRARRPGARVATDTAVACARATTALRAPLPVVVRVSYALRLEPRVEWCARVPTARDFVSRALRARVEPRHAEADAGGAQT